MHTQKNSSGSGGLTYSSPLWVSHQRQMFKQARFPLQTQEQVSSVFHLTLHILTPPPLSPPSPPFFPALCRGWCHWRPSVHSCLPWHQQHPPLPLWSGGSQLLSLSSLHHQSPREGLEKWIPQVRCARCKIAHPCNEYFCYRCDTLCRWRGLLVLTLPIRRSLVQGLEQLLLVMTKVGNGCGSYHRPWTAVAVQPSVLL